MTVDVRIINPLENNQWDRLISSTSQYSIFHSYAWIKVLLESYKYKPCFVISKYKNNPSAIFPLMEVKSFLTGNRCVSMPFSDYCDPIFTDETYVQKLFKGAVEYCKTRGFGFLDIHGGEVFFKGKNPSRRFFGHQLTLDSTPELVLNKFRNSTRRNINKSLHSGVDVHRSYSLQSMREFYHLHCITRKRHELPAQPFLFFKKIHEHIISQKSGMIIKALYHDKVIGASVFFHFGKKALYLFGASDLHYQNLRMNNLIMWEAIKWYCNNGFETLSLGRTDLDGNGLRQFKQGWGTREFYIDYFKYDLNSGSLVKNNSDKLDSTIHSIFRKLPIPISRMLGSLLYRHFG